MICEICHDNEAVLHIQEIVNSKRKEIHVCYSCAEKKGIFEDLASLDFSLDSVKSSVEEDENDGFPPKNGDVSIRCSVCGYDFSYMKSSEKLGCPSCYTEFHELLKPYLEGMQSDVQHRGKYPREDMEHKRKLKKISSLSKKLKRVLRAEDYESAARIRDRLFRLERKDSDDFS